MGEYSRRDRVVAAATCTVIGGVSLAGCGGGKGELIEQGTRIVAQNAPDIRLPRLPTNLGHTGLEMLENGATLTRRASNEVGEQAEVTYTLKPGVDPDEQDMLSNAETVICYAKVANYAPGALTDFVEGTSVYQQKDGVWELTENLIDGGFTDDPCEVASRLIPEGTEPLISY